MRPGASFAAPVSRPGMPSVPWRRGLRSGGTRATPCSTYCARNMAPVGPSPCVRSMREDDETDEDAFRGLRGLGETFRVGPATQPTRGAATLERRRCRRDPAALDRPPEPGPPDRRLPRDRRMSLAARGGCLARDSARRIARLEFHPLARGPPRIDRIVSARTGEALVRGEEDDHARDVTNDLDRGSRTIVGDSRRA